MNYVRFRREIHKKYKVTLMSLCWNIVAKIQIRLRKQSDVQQAMDRDMNPTIRPNMRRHNIPILKRVVPPAILLLFVLTFAGAEYFLQTKIILFIFHTK